MRDVHAAVFTFCGRRQYSRSAPATVRPCLGLRALLLVNCNAAILTIM